MNYAVLSLLPKFKRFGLLLSVEICYLIEHNEISTGKYATYADSFTSAEISNSSVSLSIAVFGCPKYDGNSAKSKRKEKDAIEPFRFGYISG